MLHLLETKFPELSTLSLVFDTNSKCVLVVSQEQLVCVEYNIHKVLSKVDLFFLNFGKSLDLTVYTGSFPFEKYVEKAKETGVQYYEGNWDGLREDSKIWREVANGQGYWVKTDVADYASCSGLRRLFFFFFFPLAFLA